MFNLPVKQKTSINHVSRLKMKYKYIEKITTLRVYVE